MIYRIETDDKTEHLHAVHGLDWALVVSNMDNKLRELIKYPQYEDTDERLHLLQEIRDVLHCYMEIHGVDLETIS